MDAKNAYMRLTDVDIDLQQKIWDERGKGYYGEYLVFCELYGSLTGGGKILMNLNLPTDGNKTTEVDLILIHETGLYVFEIKHYKGTIYGKSTDEFWTQYFISAPNRRFRSPVLQNKYHIAALKELYPDAPIHSCVVFTNYACNVQVVNTENGVDVFRLCEMGGVLSRRFSEKPLRYSMQDVDDIFNGLSAYSQMKEPIAVDGEVAPFSSWLQPVINRLEQKASAAEIERARYMKSAEKLRKAKCKTIAIAALVCIIVIFGAVYAIHSAAEKRYPLQDSSSAPFSQAEQNSKSAVVESDIESNGESTTERVDIDINSCVSVSDITFSLSPADKVCFTARLSAVGNTYGFALTEGTKCVVQTKAQKIYEYSVFGEHLKYNRLFNVVGKGIRQYGDLAIIELKGISDKNEIAQIKLTGIELIKLDIGKTVLKTDLEILLYGS